MHEQLNISAIAEVARRRNDSLKLFRPLLTQEDYFLSEASEVLSKGGNRTGKSLCTAVKFAAIARDVPITFADGSHHDMRLPHQKGRPLTMWVVGLQLNHIGQTIYRLLFEPGAFNIIRDEHTRRWRAYEPLTDRHRRDECRGAFPLIPDTEIKSIGWVKPSLKEFAVIELMNGTKIYAFASTSDVKQGDPVDIIWIDESIAQPGHYDEWQARISDRSGRIFWSTMPRPDVGPLIRINQRAIDQQIEIAEGIRKKADVESYTFRLSQNSHIDDEEKRKRREGWASEDVRRQREDGDFVFDSLLLYPHFGVAIHSAWDQTPETDDKLGATLRANNGVPPEDWTRELILDPGTAKPGVLFGAIPPEEFWVAGNPYYVVYDEIYTPRLDAESLAEKIKARSNDYVFHRFIIDGKAGQQKAMSYSMTVQQNYSQAFAKRGLLCETSGSGFIPGDPNWETRSHALERWMHMRPCGRPQLRIVVDRCRNLVAQLQSNVRKTIKGIDGQPIPLEKPADNQLDDLRVCLEYWASRFPKYVRPSARILGESQGTRAYKDLQKMFAKTSPDHQKSVNMGPVASI